MDRIWAPWRGEYIESLSSNNSGDSKGKGESPCIFCREFSEDSSQHNPDGLVLYVDHKAVITMNKFPYNSGHVLIAPSVHTGDLATLSEDISHHISALITKTVEALKDAYSPDGFNIGMNLGRIAGAGIPDHLHYHIVPRWSGDNNFMPAIGETKVMPEHILKTVEKLKPYF